jgi:hypothetical protein
MLTSFLLLVLGIALAAVLYQMFKPAPKRAIPAAPAPAPLDTATDLWNAKPGDTISIVGAAADFSDLDFTVDRRSAYESRGRRWIDLSGEFRGNRVYLEVHRHPDLEVMGLLDPRRLTLADVGLSEDRLADLDRLQDPSQTIGFENKLWNYDSSMELGYFENEQGDGEGLYRWLFREPDGPRFLCIEKWEGEPFDVRLAARVKPSDITVYRAA